MNKTVRSILYAAMLSVIVTACTSSAQAVQTAIANTQAAMPTATAVPTSTTIPSPTAVPSSTPNPCSDRGWKDIATYLRQFDQSRKEVKVGSSILAFLLELGSYKDKISQVAVDACSEHARQKIVSGLANQIEAYRLMFADAGSSTYTPALINGVQAVMDAKDELSSLGIKLDWP